MKGMLRKLAEQISRVKGEEPVYLLVVGGDGTINEVLNGITDFDKVRFGVIPTGSGNDFGRNLETAENTEGEPEGNLCLYQKGPER
mgnify:CR=1 FL=1